MKEHRNMLNVDTWADEDMIEAKKIAWRARATGILMVIAISTAVLVLVIMLCSCSMASEVIKEPNIAGYSLNQWCNAIYKAEGGEKTAHPYGILAHYKHTTPRQACKNTVKHNHARWVKQGRKVPYIAFLQAQYCPIGSNTDNGTCKNWSKNVLWSLNHG